MLWASSRPIMEFLLGLPMMFPYRGIIPRNKQFADERLFAFIVAVVVSIIVFVFIFPGLNYWRN
jgi:hypothetical protein